MGRLRNILCILHKFAKMHSEPPAERHPTFYIWNQSYIIEHPDTITEGT